MPLWSIAYKIIQKGCWLLMNSSSILLRKSRRIYRRLSKRRDWRLSIKKGRNSSTFFCFRGPMRLNTIYEIIPSSIFPWMNIWIFVEISIQKKIMTKNQKKRKIIIWKKLLVIWIINYLGIWNWKKNGSRINPKNELFW